MTEAERIICKLYLQELDKYHSCNEYNLIMDLIDRAVDRDNDIVSRPEVIKMLEAYPDLPVVPMVSTDVVADDYSAWWLGTWGYCAVAEIYKGREGVHFKSDAQADKEAVLYDMDGCEYGYDPQGRDLEKMTDEEWSNLYESISWKKCIAVYITTPED